GGKIEPGDVPDGRRFEPESGRCHTVDDCERTARRRRRIAKDPKLPDGRAADLVPFLFHSVARPDRPAAHPALDEVDAPALQSRVGRAEEGEEVGACTAKPREAKQREQRSTGRRLSQARPLLDRQRYAEGGEDRIERGTPALERVADDRDRLRPRTRADQR